MAGSGDDRDGPRDDVGEDAHQDERGPGPGADAEAIPSLVEGRHATFLELFLDLVFVFAVTQVAAVLASDLTWSGVGRGLLVAWLVWWLWSQFTWLGTAIDLDARSLVPYLVLLAVPPALMMAVAIPDAFSGTGRQFAAAYLVANFWSLAIQGHDAWQRPEARGPWLRYASLAAIAPVALFAGSFLDGDARVVVWTVVALLDIAGAFAAGSGDERSEWRIDATHFAERHGLFVIISLGEILVAVGAAATGLEPTASVGAGLVATVGVACVLWWAYFAYVPGVVEHRLASAVARERGRVARDLFTFGHFPVVFGLVLYAVVGKHVIAHPFDVLGAPDRWALAGAVALFVGGLAGLQWQIVHRWSRERTLTVVVVAGLCFLVGPHVDAVVLVALVGLVIAAQQFHTYRSFVRATMTA
ncbi:MAG TPA: low temperature requirement protein A [Acidimicrobiales bacterium]|nr:low temperature requirement protein A [Acidimicrobiales bacterium]